LLETLRDPQRTAVVNAAFTRFVLQEPALQAFGMLVA
jgi:hypothetical protein